MDSSKKPGASRDRSVVIARFVDACSADDRIVAAFLAGSLATGDADEYSDLDLGLIATDRDFDGVVADREALIRRLGDPLFLEDFGSDRNVFFILADGTEGELYFGRKGGVDDIDVGPFEPLTDPHRILTDAEFPFDEPDPDAQRDHLRQALNWFWHELSHFIAALGRGDLWWASGQLEALRRHCINLVRLHHGTEALDEPHEKLEKAIPVAELSALVPTFCPMERDAMLRAARGIVGFFRELAPRVGSAYGAEYPVELARLMSDRLDHLGRAPDEKDP